MRLGFYCSFHRFLRKEKLFNFDKKLALNSDRRQILVRIFRSGWVRCSWKKGVAVAVAENDFKRMIFKSVELLHLYEFIEFIPTLYGLPFLFYSKTQRNP